MMYISKVETQSSEMLVSKVPKAVISSAAAEAPKILPQSLAKHCKPKTVQLSDQASISKLFECLVKPFRFIIYNCSRWSPTTDVIHTDVCVHVLWILVPVMRGRSVEQVAWTWTEVSTTIGSRPGLGVATILEPTCTRLGGSRFSFCCFQAWISIELLKRLIVDSLQTMPPLRRLSSRWRGRCTCWKDTVTISHF